MRLKSGIACPPEFAGWVDHWDDRDGRLEDIWWPPGTSFMDAEWSIEYIPARQVWSLTRWWGKSQVSKESASPAELYLAYTTALLTDDFTDWN